MYLNTSDTRIPLRPGDVVQMDTGKRFVIDRHIAGGGFCLMYLAHQEGSGRYVALKELYPRQVEDALVQRLDNGRVLIWNPFSEIMGKDDAALMQEFSGYFQREVRLTQKAGSVYGRDGQPDRQNNLDVLKMEGPMTDVRGNIYLAIDTYQGESLRDYIERGFVRDENGDVLSNQFLAEIVHILAETSLRLSSLHDNEQMYHLDLSPDNIYLAYAAGKTRRQPFIIDYGSAYDKSNPKEPFDHKYTYNPHSAPEIIALAENPDPEGFYHADESSDTYSLTSILFYAATGLVYKPEMRMFRAQWEDRIINAYSSGISRDPDPESFAAALIRFFDTGLSSAQTKRFASAKALREKLTGLEKSYREYGNLLPCVPRDEMMSYLVLEKHPLYRYKSADGDIHVLCLGSGVFVKRMILSMLGCGQILGSHLHIHTVSNEPAESFYGDLLKSAPELKYFSNIFANAAVNYVTFCHEQVDDVLEEEACRKIAQKHYDSRYVLISLGKNRLNAEAAGQYARQLAQIGRGQTGKTVINYYCDEDVAMHFAPGHPMAELPDWLEVAGFADDLTSYTVAQRALGMRTIRLAHMYNKLSDPRISLAETESQIAEDPYSQKSSCTAALHLKYKLAGLGIDPEADKETVITQYIAALRGDAYGQLLENEHNRWMLNMVSEGYRKPTVEELRRYGFETVGNRFNGAWKSKDLKLHPCLVPCGPEGIRLAGTDWDTYDTEEKIVSAPFDELDKVSLLLHMLSREKCELGKDVIRQQFEAIRERLDAAAQRNAEERDSAEETGTPADPFEPLKRKLEKVRDSICGETYALQYCADRGRLEELQRSFDAAGINISGEIGILREKLAVFVEYAAEKDYKKPDVAIIDNLLWVLYAQEDVSLIKLSGKSIVSNITAPLVIEPKRLVYFGAEQRSEWVDFLENHGYCGQITFHPCADISVDRVCGELQQLVACQNGRVVVDITEANEIAVVATQRLLSKREDVALIRTTPEGTVENIQNFCEAPAYALNTRIDADEIYSLHGAKVASSGPNYMDLLYDQVPALWEVYREFKEDWVKITALFAHKRANSSELYIKGIAIAPEEPWEEFSATVVEEQWESLNVADVFEKIQADGFIRGFDVRQIAPGRLKVTFRHPAQAANGYFKTAFGNFFRLVLPNAFAPFRYETFESKDFRSLSVGSGYYVNLRDTDLTFSDKRNLSAGRTERISYQEVVPALERLEQIGILLDLNVSIQTEPVQRVNISFTYSSLAAKTLLQTAGNILELYIWYEAKRTRFFDSVQTNSNIVWKEGLEQDQAKGLENELDVILTKGLTSLIISAKTAKYNKEHLYEIRYLTDRFSVNSSKPVIIYTSRAAIENGHKTDELEPVKNRARAMGIYLLDMNELEASNCSLGEKLIAIAQGQDKP